LIATLFAIGPSSRGEDSMNGRWLRSSRYGGHRQKAGLFNAQVIDITDEQRAPTFGTAAVKQRWIMVAVTP